MSGDEAGGRTGTEDGALRPWSGTKVVGAAEPRIDGAERVSGGAVYTRDIALPDMLHAAVLGCPHAHAELTRIDARRARSMPGVRAVLTAFDAEAEMLVPGPWWIADGPPMRLLERHCRFAGEEVAAVAADTLDQAREAARAIVAEYRPLPFVVDAEEALAPGAPAVHEGGNLVRPPARFNNYSRGDVVRGRDEAVAVVDGVYRTSCLIHSALEVHGSVARWDGNRLTVWDSTQGVFDMQQYLAQVFGLPLSAVRVIGGFMGGGFGGKAELGRSTVLAALLARRTGRPVKLCLSREETFRSAGNRPPNALAVRLGARADGTLCLLELDNLGAVGAYADLAFAGPQTAELYRCPNVRYAEREAFTNTGKARAMRAPGFPQFAWAVEQAIDELAGRLGIDPVELRLANVPDESQLLPGLRFTSSGFARCLREGAEAFGWQTARSRPRDHGPRRRGVGMAAAMWDGAGGPPATAIVKVFPDGSAGLNTGAADLGTGTKTVLAMIVAEELGVPLDRIAVEHADTATTQYAQLSGGSTTVTNNAPAVRAAARDARRQLLELAADQLGVEPSALSLGDGAITSAVDPAAKLAVSELKALREQGVLVGIGRRGRNPEGLLSYSWAAHFAEVEVDTRTGKVHVLRLLAAHDSGRVMNLLSYRNQVFGGVAMGIGFALSEERVVDPRTGKVLNPSWQDYHVPTILEMPELACLPVDPGDELCNTVGAKGLGEPATIPTAAAVANAIHHATGVRFRHAPVTPARLLEGLARRYAEG